MKKIDKIYPFWLHLCPFKQTKKRKRKKMDVLNEKSV